MKAFRKLMVMALVLMLIAGLFPVRGAQAATKPDKPGITVKANDDGKSATITIAKTKNAQGYKIMVKKPGASKFTKLTTLKKDGTAERSYTAKKLADGEYTFKVRAYLKSGNKTVSGKYSKSVSVKIGKTGNDNKTSTDDKTVKYISTRKELAAVEVRNAKVKYVLKNDMDMTGWTPLETVYCSIDGAGHVLKNLSVPFIGSLYGGTVENLTFDVNMTKVYQYQDYKMVAPIGFLAGGNDLKDIGTVRNCKTIGTIAPTGGEKLNKDDYNDAVDVGGIVAFNPNNMGYIERCVNEADITVKEFPNAAVGGIVGMAGGGTTREVIVECKNAGNIVTDVQRYAQSYCGIGGICGNQSGLAIIKNCLNTGTVRNSNDNEEYPRKGAGISGAINSPIMVSCVSIGSSDYALAGTKLNPQTITTSWMYSGAGFTDVYYGGDAGDAFMWDGSPVEVQGVKKVSDITDQSAFAGLDFKNVWKMGENGPDLRNIP